MFSIIQAAGWPIWPLIACSVVALALVIERLLSLRSDRAAPHTLIDKTLLVSRHTIPAPGLVTKLAQNALLGQVLASSLQAIQADPRIGEADLRSTIEGAGPEATRELGRYSSALSSSASAAPLLGLLGTVVGMIEVFGVQSAAPSAGTAQLAQLAPGVAIALDNTAVGLMVAIPSLIFWHYFRARVGHRVQPLELADERFMHRLNGLRRAA